MLRSRAMFEVSSNVVPSVLVAPIACQWLRDALTIPPSCRNRKRRQDGRRETIIGDPTNGGYFGQYSVALHRWPFYAGSKICVCNNVNHGVLVMVSWVCMLNGWWKLASTQSCIGGQIVCRRMINACLVMMLMEE